MTQATDDVGRSAAARRPTRRTRFLAVFGPGLVVMLADTDVGSVITAGQSGVLWGYRLLGLQLVLIPLLYMVQELTVRLGIFTGRGHGELVRLVLGRYWAALALAILAVTTAGALLTEFSGVAGVGELYGLPRVVTLPLAVAALLAVVTTGSYRRAERAAIVVGLCELAFFFVAWAAHPHLSAVLAEGLDIPWTDQGFRYLAAANLGAVIMPWMIFYQQSAIADKKLQPHHYTAARLDTAVGAVITQLIICAVLIACAATLGSNGPGAALTSVGDMSRALTPFLGSAIGNLVFGLGVLGAGLVTAIVCSLAFAWAVGEVTGHRHAFAAHPFQSRWFYAAYAAWVVGGATLVGLCPDLVSLSLGVQVMNMLMLPIVLGMLIMLAIKALPPARRLRGWYLWCVVGMSGATCAIGVFAGISGAGLLH